ncbi:VC2046/SO_2500 family protein [Thalassotalea ganghwensis]
MQVVNKETQLLVEEKQLGTTLNECVHTQRRSDFSLLLAMLIDDVCQHSQFTLPKSELVNSTSDEAQLRKYFSVPSAQPLSISSLDDLATFGQSELVENKQLASMRLENALFPKALCFRNDASHISSEVMSNTSIHCQNDCKPKQRQSFNANGWLKSLQETIVRAPLMAVNG